MYNIDNIQEPISISISFTHPKIVALVPLTVMFALVHILGLICSDINIKGRYQYRYNALTRSYKRCTGPAHTPVRTGLQCVLSVCGSHLCCLTYGQSPLSRNTLKHRNTRLKRTIMETYLL